MKKACIKILSIILAAVLLVPPMAPAGLASSAGSTDFGRAHIDCNPIITYNEETGTYRLDLELNAELYDHLVNTEENDIPDRGYFSANYPGWYLIELWGGKGASLVENGTVKSPGGNGGYVYAKVYMEKDDVLFYSLGGNGKETYVSGEGGGTNGGGNGGTIITYGIGGGGGYSAIFLFDDPVYFKTNYLNAQNEFAHDNISEFDRTTKYIMIAGGGGGAGAPADGASFVPSGGNGGNILTSSVVGAVEAIGATVAGTYYSGADGKSSGTSSDYIGHGGTNVPGERSSTSWNWVSGELPNNWVGTYNSNILPGAGGAGNLRGGAGGAGYCGGSGGIQQSILVPSHVGGGGGGSSFVASGTNISTILEPEEEALLDHNNPKLDLSSGAVSITYLPGVGTGYEFNSIKDLSLTFTISDYFNVSNFDYTQHGVDGAGNPTYDNVTVESSGANGGEVTFTIDHISLLPTAKNLTGKVHVYLDLTPKNAFLGGNDVPLLVGNSVSISGVVDSTATTKTILLEEDNCHVNVPLKFSVLPRDHVANGEITLSRTDMYIDTYASVRANVASNPFLESVSDYTVTGGYPALPAMVTESTVYTVSFTVVPTDDPNINPVAGPQCVTTTFSDFAHVNVLALHEGHLNGQLISFAKNLIYNNDGTYTFSIRTTADNSRSAHIPDPETAYGAGSLTFNVPHDGVYLIQAWGGNGGDGQSFKGLLGTNYSGGTGGTGGYVYAYLPLKAGDRVYTEKIGVAGTEGSQSSNTGGTGGTYSIVKIYHADTGTDEVFIIAGGGGGGGNAIVGKKLGITGKNGGAGSAATTINTALSMTGDPASINLDAYIGTAGTAGLVDGDGWSAGDYIAGTGGAAGINYYNPAGFRNFSDYEFEHVETQSEFNALVANSKPTPPEELTSVSPDDGVVRVSCIELSTHTHVTDTLSGYTLNFQFSDYFEVLPTGGNYFSAKNNCENVQNTADETLVYDAENTSFSGNLLTIAGIEPHQEGEGSGEEFNSSIDFTVTVKLRPKNGFLGGNDVPILKYVSDGNMRYGASISQKDTSSVLQTAPINRNYDADFANVALSPAVTAGSVTGNTLEFEQGAEGTYTRAQLYTWTKGWQKPTGETAWTADFLNYSEKLILEGTADDAGEGPWSIPDANRVYSVEVGVVSPAPEKAKVGPEVSGVFAQSIAKVVVTPRINFVLDGLTTNLELDTANGVNLDNSTDLEIILTPDTGRELPASIQILYKNTDVSVTHSYDSSTGRVVIPRASMTNTMILTATAGNAIYRLGYAYQLPGSEETNVHTQSYYYGETVHMWDYTPPEYPGHHFIWHWYTNEEDGVAAGESLDGKPMPPRELWVVGVYRPNNYVIRVNYEWEDGIDNPTPPATTVISSHYFGDTINIPSPAVAGFAPDIAIVGGQIDEALIANAVGEVIDITVTYRSITGQLVVHYVTEDTAEVVTTTTTLTEGETYTVTPEEKVGYTAYPSIATGTMSADGVELTITYKPNVYDVNLVIPNEDPIPDEVYLTRKVYYNSIYGYTQQGSAKVFESLPTQVNKTGSKFGGWYMLIGENRIEVTNETQFSLDHLVDGVVTIYAHFDTEKYIVTVEHAFLDGTTAAPTVNELVPYGTRYTVISETAKDPVPESVKGYSSYIIGVKDGAGVVNIRGQYLIPASQVIIESMPAQPVDRAFIYVGDVCPLTINYIYMSNGGKEERRETYTDRDSADPLRFGDSYSIESPVADGYTCTQPLVSGTMNSLDELEVVDGEVKGRTIDVFYYAKPPVISVNISWGTMSFDYSRGPWDPETHRYQPGTFTPSSNDGSVNKITVTSTNESTISVNAVFTYESVSPYDSIKGYFTSANNAAAEAISLLNVPKNSSKSAWLWLKGSLPDTITGTITGGKCTVTITGGG